jgi:hypothetical protein
MPDPSTQPAAPRLRLMQITHDLDLGGLQQVIYNLCRTLDRNRFEISVLCLREKGLFANDVEALGIPVYLLEQKERGADYLAFLKVAKLLREQRIDVVHTPTIRNRFSTVRSARSQQACEPSFIPITRARFRTSCDT